MESLGTDPEKLGTDPESLGSDGVRARRPTDDVCRFLRFLELILADTANRTGPIIRQFLERNVVVLGRVIDITAYLADILLHGGSSFLV